MGIKFKIFEKQPPDTLFLPNWYSAQIVPD